MIELTDGGDYVVLFALAAAFGALGGLVFDLLQTRAGGNTGAIEMPTGLSKRYRDWGVFASIIVGAVAAMAAIWFFPPAETTTVSNGVTETIKQYDYGELIPLALIIGSAGSSFLSAFQARALALVKQQEADQTRAVAEAQLDAVAVAPPADLTARVDAAKKTIAATALR